MPVTTDLHVRLNSIAQFVRHLHLHPVTRSLQSADGQLFVVDIRDQTTDCGRLTTTDASPTMCKKTTVTASSADDAELHESRAIVTPFNLKAYINELTYLSKGSFTPGTARHGTERRAVTAPHGARSGVKES